MSEFRVDTITDKTGSGKPNFPNGLTLNGVDAVTNTPTWSETGSSPSASSVQSRILTYHKGGRNLLINGAMNIHQRSGTTVTGINTSGYYTADRWLFEDNVDTSVFSQVVDTSDVPSGTEFRKALRTTCTTAKASLGVNEFIKISQRFEGQNLQVMKKGTSNAEFITVSFWVKTNFTGNLVCELDDTQNSRQISRRYAVTANTWEFKTLFFPSDGLGSLSNDTSARLQVSFWMAAGTNFTSGTINDTFWASYSGTNVNRAGGQTNVASSVNNFFAITGVQMEIGVMPTPIFEYRSYGTELALCQRYYYRSIPGVSGGTFCIGYANSTTVGEGFIKYPVIMRSIPSALEQSGTATDYQIRFVITNTNCSSVPIYVNNTTTEGGYVNFTVASGLTAGQGIALRANTTTAFLGWSAEL